MYIHRYTHTYTYRSLAYVHTYIITYSHLRAYTRHFTGDHASCKYACIFKFTRVICVLICKLDHSTTSLPKNRLYSLFSFRFKSFPKSDFVALAEQDRAIERGTVVHVFFIVIVNLWIYAIRGQRSVEFRWSVPILTPFHPSVSFHRSEYAMSQGIEDQKKKKKYCKRKRVVVPPFDFLEV